MVRWDKYTFSLIFWIPEISSSLFSGLNKEFVNKIKDFSNNDQVLLLTKFSTNELLSLLKSVTKEKSSEHNMKNLGSLYKYNPDNIPINQARNIMDDTVFMAGQNIPEFRLEKKEIPLNFKSKTKYKVVKNLNAMLEKRPSQSKFYIKNKQMNHRNKIIYNFLISQLNNLCCNKHVNKDNIFNDMTSSKLENIDEINHINVKPKPTYESEHIFLIVNEDIDNLNDKHPKVTEVDPSSLSTNSTIIPLARLPNYLDEDDLLKLMQDISRELAKSKYLSMLIKVSKGQIQNNGSVSLLNSPRTRRYIKPHRCNYQAPLSKLFNGGPRWIICTGYLNINTPSLYD